MSSPVDPSSESSSTTTPVATEEPASLDLKAMISTFGPESVEPLEEAVSKQAAGTAPYELDLNLALLRLYNFYPRHYNNQIVVKILCLALMQLPENHFVLTLSAVSPTRVCIPLEQEQEQELELELELELILSLSSSFHSIF